MNLDITQELRSIFKRYFKSEPALFFSPGRINLIGDHTDYNMGLVLPGAIDRGITVALGLSSSTRSKLISTTFHEHIEFDVNDLNPRTENHWSDYVIGVIAEIKKFTIECPQLHIVVGSDLPIGCGLSSSAALENAISFGLNACLELQLEKIELAKIGQRTENEHIGVESGIMDQFIGLFGKKDHLILLDCQALHHKLLKWPFTDVEIVLVNSKVRRELVDSQFNKRRQSCFQVAKACGKHSLREVNIELLENNKHKISKNDLRKARFVLEENQRVHKSGESIESADISTLGKAMVDSHAGLRDKYNVSCPELDFLVDQALKQPEVLGSRMMGGGFGGCTINLIKRSTFREFRKSISQSYETKFQKTCDLYSVNLSDGTHQIQ
ncbi:MAG: galactokinase [Flavobacteriaceae bacterium]|nr:galactokinase [Bacteroidia bacterium]NNK88790.1 galactokinase [Flavobacteriaceae bacterium]